MKWNGPITYALEGDAYIITTEDLTYEKAQQTKLAEVTKLKNDIIDNLPLMLFVKEAKTLKYVEFNKLGTKWTGIESKEIIGESDLKFWPKEEAEFFMKKDRERWH